MITQTSFEIERKMQMDKFSANRRTSLALSARTILLLLPLAIAGGSWSQAQGKQPPKQTRDRLVIGDMALVPDNLGVEHLVTTWAKVTREDDVEEVGVTIPVALFDNQSLERGDGPAGAIASLVFPELVRELTYFDHFELHTQPHGHPAPPGSTNPDRNRNPHFDFHFYSVPEEVVWEIPLALPPLPPVPASRLPAGYLQPGPSEPEMGRHAAPIWSLTDPNPLSTIMIAGFMPDGTEMHFIEPMISRDRLLECNDFELPVPMPAAFGRVMLYPTKCEAEYDRELDAYHFVFSKFVSVE
jgi:hypothetical protein